MAPGALPATNPVPPTMRYLTMIGRIFFGAALVASGVQQLVVGEFVRLVPKLPAWIPAPALWPGVVGVVLVIAGGAIIADRMRARAATVVAVLLGLNLMFRVPEILANPGAGFVWTNPCKVLALIGGALVLAGSLPGANGAGQRWAGKLVFLGPVLLGVFLLVCGIQHFVYASFVDTLVPAWIPPRPRFWTYFSALALLAGGAGVLLPKTARLAAICSALMIFLWVLLLHIPRSVQLKSAFEWAGVFEALAISGVALLVAGTWPKRAKPAA